MGEAVAILAAAGSRKTEHVVESALSVKDGHVLIITYTNENQRTIVQRIEHKVGLIPSNIKVIGWFAFLITHCAKPFQREVTDEPFVISGLNFKGRRSRFVPKSELRYFIDGNAAMYRDGVSDFVCEVNKRVSGALIHRLERFYSHIFIDEVQDFVGYDLDVLDLLIGSQLEIVMVGDPRQSILTTNFGSRNRRYRGSGLMEWFAERADVCRLEVRDCSYRCNQSICDFADAIFPDLPATRSVGVDATDHDGVFEVRKQDVSDYVTEYSPVVLRHDRNVDTMGLTASNIGLAKGSTFARVLIFPTKPMLGYLRERDPAKLKAPERLYVAVTRAEE